MELPYLEYGGISVTILHVKKTMQIDVDILGKMLAEYLVTQGWAEKVEGNIIILSENGIRKLTGPPYFFDLSNPDPDMAEQPIDDSMAHRTFTWYQKNFTPGKTKQSPRKNMGNQQTSGLHEWKPGQLGSPSKIGFSGFQSAGPGQGGKKTHYNKNSKKSKGSGRIKMKSKLPPIARTRKFRGKKRNK